MIKKHTSKFCKRCLYSIAHPLGLVIDDQGVCSGCRIHEEKDALNWDSRFLKLQQLVKPYKSKNGNYDCIIPVSGAQDSYYIVHIVKNKLGMNPLLVSYNKYFNTPLGIRNLSNLRIQFNCDILIKNTNPNSVKKITRTTLRRFGSIYWTILAGHSVFPVQIAIQEKIPLIIWGAHQGIEQVGMFSYTHEVEMTRRYRKDHDLMGHEADDLLSNFDILKEEDIFQYRYPDDFEINKLGLRGIYLSNYLRWDPKAQHEEMIKKYNYKTSNFSRTFDCYDYADCYNYMDLHDFLKLCKHGYSKVTDHACREIRFGRINRNQGLTLVKNYELKPLKFLKLFTEWLGVDYEAINFIVDLHKNKKFWNKKYPIGWDFKSLADLNKLDKHVSSSINFISNNKLSYDKEDKYITVGKGYP